MVNLYYTLLVDYILLWHYSALKLHCYKMLQSLQCYTKLQVLVCLPQFADVGEMNPDDSEAVSQIPMSYKHFSSNKF